MDRKKALKTSDRAASASSSLRKCINCGASTLSRKRITVARRNGRGSITVSADACATCNEKYFDLQAMREIES